MMPIPLINVSLKYINYLVEYIIGIFVSVNIEFFQLRV